jgi:CubicO group peptidase (beta-lactamase class C family)
LKATEPTLRRQMAEAAVPGLAVARVEGDAVHVVALGVTEAGSTQAVTEHTVFDVASLSKPVAAYIALQLVDQGVLDLDTPLSAMGIATLPPALVGSPITARHVLTHTSGLPNLRGPEPLKLHFPAGRWFSYSSVGFAYLQAALEALTGEGLEALAQRLVFQPLGMASSSFEWRARFEGNFAWPHEGERRLDKHRPAVAHASYSLQTTAGDYARFMRAVLKGQGLSPAMHRAWFTPLVNVPRQAAEHLLSDPPVTEPNIGWWLGW